MIATAVAWGILFSGYLSAFILRTPRGYSLRSGRKLKKSEVKVIVAAQNTSTIK